ncbi:hypothetical protein FisN_13Lu169 [Fistulifera solaris]|uniref:Uncharacterized protein n=1 Tax=Fistulifera solaris TaxID=1519565 RepID=A0A1Z5JFH0_FISSO|nr:hypothetical protein FisN_13Lu169 [Fistulifera solaris]|eukprot:GAX12676.1 hypothetical protein FisN_13Lu169 [Fistulifera solaris]
MKHNTDDNDHAGCRCLLLSSMQAIYPVVTKFLIKKSAPPIDTPPIDCRFSPRNYTDLCKPLWKPFVSNAILWRANVDCFGV